MEMACVARPTGAKSLKLTFGRLGGGVFEGFRGFDVLTDGIAPDMVGAVAHGDVDFGQIDPVGLVPAKDEVLAGAEALHGQGQRGSVQPSGTMFGGKHPPDSFFQCQPSHADSRSNSHSWSSFLS